MQFVFYVIFVVLVVAADQLTKALVVANIPLGGHVDFLPGFLDFTYLRNTGAAFSSFSGGTKLLALLSLVITVLIGIAIAKDWLRHPFAQWSMAVVMAGAFGNFIDRAFIGYVTDMVDTLFMNFAVYNFADICVVLGILALAIYIIFFYEKCEGKKAHGHSDDQG